ncbi:MBOAT family O-acyltransferase [Zunongwangia sp. F260]|uniref:MBOAT family O-acyltransferase n=1 Tax=Autumnicola lenta TaxID=3075593 RepID=A0ABU3CK35_9FLAO|nr:MBOAT family O-acyltransferase [Zunongwangia sp. F260]MDT0646676.1 MBOAT family O-acyltransferase [Zunongwangia sp. F260]
MFNSFDFGIFFTIVFSIYWMIGGKKISFQNLFLLIASYFFYAWWDWRFLILIIASTVVDYALGLQLERTSNTSLRKIWLYCSLFFNLGLLAFLKYFNFFIESINSGVQFLGIDFSTESLNIILPVGISFYTFQTLSYTIDIYRKRLNPTKNFIAFATYVTFFPQLVAGPIERAINLLPQFHKKRSFNYREAVNGCKQILWGLAKKVIIADNCARYVDIIFDDPTQYNSSTLLLGAFLFALQIYGDFSGYSDIAIGTAKLFGLRLSQNFNFPYFSRDIAEFWRRWHISLSTWFRDYLYIPLGGSKRSRSITTRNVFVIFLVSGFWHGANWTFIAWGAMHALLFLPLILLGWNRRNTNLISPTKYLPGIKEFFQVTFTFLIIVLTWIMFRADSIEEAMLYYSKLLSFSLLELPNINVDYLFLIIPIFLLFILAEWFGRNGEYAIEHLFSSKPRFIRWSMYLAIAFCIYLMQPIKSSEFIYFQF